VILAHLLTDHLCDTEIGCYYLKVHSDKVKMHIVNSTVTTKKRGKKIKCKKTKPKEVIKSEEIKRW
jgi:hypothetical protein